MNKNIWEGIYKSFKEAPVVGKGFNSDQWIRSSRKKALKLLANLKRKKTIPEVVAYRTSLLPFLAALMNSKSGKIKILDFGGGLGITYIQVISSLVNNENIEYHIVENEKICKEAERIFRDDEKVHFHTSLPNNSNEVDIVHLSSSLHYIENWKELIIKLADYQPEYFVFVDLPAGDIPTYVTAQNYYESKIPVWFFNVNEVINVMSSVDFKLLFKSLFIATILGKEQEIPQDNFPKEYRLRNSCNLLFSRSSK